MVRSVVVNLTEGQLREAAIESRLTEASKSQILRFAILRTIMSAREARETVFGNPEEITETNGQVSAKIPDHEIAMIERHFPDVEISTIARAGLLLSAGEPHSRAWEDAKRTRGPKPKQTTS
jgi:hypothetical protein